VICNLNTGAPIRADVLNDIMKQLKGRIIRLLESEKITDIEETEQLQHLLKTKKWNPYCIRHSAITADSDHLPEYALKKKVRWSMNSKQGSRYIKKRMGNELKNKILEYNGIVVDSTKKQKAPILNCPRCEITNALENKYCSKCSYPLTSEVFDLIKQDEENRIKLLMEEQNNKIAILREDMENKFQQILLKVNVEKVMKRE
jgi:integrase/recombinase XerD